MLRLSADLGFSVVFGAVLAALSVLLPGAVPAAAALGMPDRNGNLWFEGWLCCGHEPEASRRWWLALWRGRHSRG